MDQTFFFTAECGFYAALRLQRAVTLSGWVTVDDTPPPRRHARQNTARDRFQAHLAKSVTTPGALRDYIET